MNTDKNSENSLPEGYVLVKHVNAKNDGKQVIIYSLLSFVPTLMLVPLLCVIAAYCNGYNIFLHWADDRAFIPLLVSCGVIILYIILHELVHGVTYKCLTGGKLTFGITGAVAFCGVPHLYVRKKASLSALIMPFAVFSVIFTALTAGLWFISPLYGICAGFVLSVHLGGCVGDLHWVMIYLTTFKHCNTLMRDSGPEQWLYIPADEAQKYGIPIIK